ncbi:10197_t:CDS:2, partial [Gigaspora margarita]
NCNAVEALDKIRKNRMEHELLFGVKLIMFGGNFCQILPVIPRGSHAQKVNASLKYSYIWSKIEVFYFNTNMRVQSGSDYNYFKDFLLNIGNRTESTISDDIIRIHDQMVPGDTIIYQNYNTVSDDTRGLYQQEYLNSITPNGLPSYELCLKISTSIMCLCNLDSTNGLCNGTRLICKSFQPNVIGATITTVSYKENEMRQFPIKLAFVLTIKKSQGQTIPRIGLYIPEHVFAHGQLYVAFSRARTQHDIKVLVKNGSISEMQGTFTHNI